MKHLLIYWIIISALSVALTVWDKEAAKRRAMRVPESVLLLFAALGGGLAMYVTMFVIRHKTRHPKFTIGIPVIFVLQFCALLFAVWRFTESRL